MLKLVKELNYSRDKTIKLETSRSTQSPLMNNPDLTTISFNGISKIDLRKRSQMMRFSMKLSHSAYIKMRSRSKKLLKDQITTKLEIDNTRNNNHKDSLNNKQRSLSKTFKNSLEHQLEFLSRTTELNP